MVEFSYKELVDIESVLHEQRRRLESEDQTHTSRYRYNCLLRRKINAYLAATEDIISKTLT